VQLLITSLLMTTWERWDVHNAENWCFLLPSIIQELIEKTRERQAETLSEITWCGRTVPVKNERVRVALLSIQQNAKQLSESGSSAEQKLSLFESLLKELIEAQQSLRDELRDDQVCVCVTVVLLKYCSQ
jgi:RNA-binding signal recognition particle 68